MNTFCLQIATYKGQLHAVTCSSYPPFGHIFVFSFNTYPYCHSKILVTFYYGQMSIGHIYLWISYLIQSPHTCTPVTQMLIKINQTLKKIILRPDEIRNYYQLPSNFNYDIYLTNAQNYIAEICTQQVEKLKYQLFLNLYLDALLC